MEQITLNQATIARQAMEKKQLADGRVHKPRLLNTRGDAGIQVYFLKTEISAKFSPHFDRAADLHKERKELEEKQQTNKTGLSKKDQERLEEVKADLDSIGDKTEHLELTHGKIAIDAIQGVATVADVQAIDFAIQFSEPKDNPVKLTITANQASAASQALETTYFPNGQVRKSNLQNITGPEVERIYRLIKAISDTFADKFNEAKETFGAMEAAQKELAKVQRQLDGLDAEEDKAEIEKAVASFEAKRDELSDDLKAIGEEELEIELPTGKIQLANIKQHINADDMDAIGFALEFESAALAKDVQPQKQEGQNQPIA